LSAATTALIHASFALIGVVTTLLGPLLPWLAQRWLLQDHEAGALFTAQFVGSLAGIALSGVLAPRRGFRATLVLGTLVMSAATATLATDVRAVGTLAVLCNGVGLGITIPTTNLAVAEARPTANAAALSVLNLAWGAGAVACAPIVTWLSGAPGGPRTLLLGLGGALLALAAAIARAGIAGPASRAGNDARGWRAALPTRPVYVIGLLLFLYVGTETSLGGWVATYAGRMEGTAGSITGLAPAFFWGPVLLGRALAPALLRGMSEAGLLLAGLLLATLGSALVLATGRLELVVAGVASAGLGLAPVFPVGVALLTRSLGPEAARRSSPAFALAGLGGATLPWLVGVVSTAFDSLRVGLAVPFVASLAMVALHLGLVRERRPRAARRPAAVQRPE
jgi:fucose permease